jgi:hypothetical protein
VIYRLSESGDGTRITFRHSLVGRVPDDFRQHMAPGWSALHQRAREAAEAASR